MIQQPLEIAPVCTRTLQLVRTTCHYFILAHTLGSCNTALSSEGAGCSGAEPSNANISFPEHFEGKRQSGEMYQKDCPPLLSTFCKFQRLKVKRSRAILVLSASTQSHTNGVASPVSMMCRLSRNSTVLWQPLAFVCDC